MAGVSWGRSDNYSAYFEHYFSEANGTIVLHQGEAEAICLALEKKARLCLIDDKDGRIIAQSNNLPITGTLGILLKAKKTGLISSVKPLIDALRTEHNFWIRDDMYQKVLYTAREKSWQKTKMKTY